MNRSAFENKMTAMELVNTLMNFEAKVNSDIELSKSNKGDMKSLRAQTVKSNLPESFRIQIGAFVGYEKKSINVELEVDPSTFECALVSPDLKEYEDGLTDTAISDVLFDIRSIAPDIAIIEY
jgi:hypothetical protein